MSDTPIDKTAATPEVALERLEADICELAARQAAEEYLLLVRLAEFDRREGWAGWGIQSCAQWFAWKCGLGIGAAREKVRVARRLEEMPLVAGAYAKGELSYSKVRALARAVEPATEATLLELARDATTAQLETRSAPTGASQARRSSGRTASATTAARRAGIGMTTAPWSSMPG